MLIVAAGSNGSGQLSNGTIDDSHHFQPVLWSKPPAGSQKVNKLALGGNHTILLLNSGELWACGDGSKGQLGPLGSQSVLTRLEFEGDEVLSADDSVVDVAAGWDTSFLVVQRKDASDRILSFGGNDYGDLGIGTTGREGSFAINSVPLDHMAPGEGLISVRAIAAGIHHTVMILHLATVDGSCTPLVAGWGAARQGQLGPVDANPKIICKSTPQIVQLLNNSPPLDVAAGNQHTIILHQNGSVSALGSNRKSQLTVFSEEHVWGGITCTWNGSYGVKNDGETSIVASGSNSHGQLADEDGSVTMRTIRLPDESNDSEIRQLSAGSEHCLVLTQSKHTSTDEVWGWGWNEHGNLGLSHTKDVLTVRKIWPPSLQPGAFPMHEAVDVRAEKIESVWAGCGTSWIVLDNPQK